MFTGKFEYQLRESNHRAIRVLAGRYSLLRDKVFKTFSQMITFFIKLLPFRLVAMMKESLRLKAQMPYVGEIKVDVDSYKEVRRAGFCFREKETVQWIEQCADKGGVLYDVGANIGAVSLIYAANLVHKKKEFNEGTILSFEPSFSTFSKLCKNIYINGFSGKILPFSQPLSSAPGQSIFNFSSINIGESGHSLQESMGKTSYQMQLPVFMISIDQLVYDYGYRPPHWLKIDVDGHDFEVLKGASKVITEGYVQSVLIEKNSHENKIRDFLEENGFKEVKFDVISDDINLRFDRA